MCYQSSWEICVDGWSCVNCVPEHFPRWVRWIFALAQRARLVFPAVRAAFCRSTVGQARVEVGRRLRIAPGRHHWPKKGLRLLVLPPNQRAKAIASDKRSSSWCSAETCVLHGERNFSPSSMSVINVLMKNGVWLRKNSIGVKWATSWDLCVWEIAD